MSTVKQIQCPACGSNSTFKKSDGSHMCNYCQSSFEVEENRSEPKKINVEDLKKIMRERIASNPEALKRGKKLGCSILIAGMVFIAGIGTFVYTTIKKATTTSSGGSLFDYWQEPSQNMYKCFIGSKGAVIFLLMQQSSNKLDSVRYLVKLINPEDGKIIKEKPFGPAMAWKELFNYSNRLESTFQCFNNIAYNTPKDSGLIGFDIYSWEEVVTSKTLANKFPELKSGISKAEYSWNKDSYKITSNTADEFYFNASDNTLNKKEKQENRNKPARTGTGGKDTLVTRIYLSEGKRPQLFKINRKIKTDNDEARIDSRYSEEYEKDKSWYKSSFKINSVEKVNDKIYFMAKDLARFEENILVLYTEDLSKTSKVILELIDARGLSVWQNKDANLQILKSRASSDKMYCDYVIDGNLVVINTNENGQKSTGISLKSGKTLWTYSPGK